MKKKFEKPLLIKSELHLKENIALSWEYYDGIMTQKYHFIHRQKSDGSIINNPNDPDQGCYDLFNATLNTSESGTGQYDYAVWFAYHSSEYSNINSPYAMAAWMNTMQDQKVCNCIWG